MRRILTAAVAMLAASIPTAAQDVDWDRWFVGFDAGYVFRSESNTAWGQVDSQGASIGASVGRWWQMDQFVLGAEAGLAFGGAGYQRERLFVAFPPANATWTYDEVVTLTARAKIGLPLGNVLPYFAVGPQYVHQSHTMQSTWSFESTPVAFGFLATAGVEAMVTDNISVRAEYGLNLKLPGSTDEWVHSGWGGRAGVNFYFD